MEEAQRDSKQKSELSIAAVLNDKLNQHAKRFLQELQTSILIDVVEDATGGGAGESGSGSGSIRTGDDKEDSTPPKEPPQESGGGQGTGGSLEVPGSTQSVRRPKFPQVLLSGEDEDPSNPGHSKYFTDRHPPLEQDDMDKQHNVWWINTSHPFAQEAVRHGGAKGSAFKSFQLFMFRDVVQREGLRIVQRREAELGLDRVENELNEFSNRFLAELPRDLFEELLG